MKMKKFFRYLAWGILGLAVLGTFVYLFKKSQKPPTEYNIYTVERAEVIEKKSIISGSIVPRDEVAIVPQISGIVEEILCKPGQAVQAGDVIARLSVVPNSMELSQAQSRLERAEIDFRHMTERYKRDKDLQAQGVVPQEEFEASSLNYERARKEVEDAREALSIVRTGAGRANSKSSSTLVRATVSGIILDIPVRVGHSVIQANTFNPGTTIATIANMKDLLFRGKLDEIEVGRVRQGMPVRIIIGALGQLTLDATIEYIAPKAYQESGSSLFLVEAAIHLDNDSAIRAGMSANAEVITEAVHDVLTIPESALTFENDSTFVQIVEAEQPELRTHRQPVTIGISDGVQVEIKRGLKEKQKVRGGEKIKE